MNTKSCQICSKKIIGIPVNIQETCMCHRCYDALRELQNGNSGLSGDYWKELESEEQDLIREIAIRDKDRQEIYEKACKNSNITFEKVGLHSKRRGWSREPISNFINIDNEARRVKAMQGAANRKRDELEGLDE